MPILYAILAALLVSIAAVVPGAPAQEPSGAIVEVLPPPEITGRDAMLAWHRMGGTEPDFGALTELELAERPPDERLDEAGRRWVRVLAGRRVRAEFAEFDLDRAYTVTLGADILGYDRELGGIPIEVEG
ncbi:MAG TPA: hypothetical protein VNB28_09200, partial [Methylomirabilota bacterium]|nr:hypothetical protein [Methylomirabilota bacterium]